MAEFISLAQALGDPAPATSPPREEPDWLLESPTTAKAFCLKVLRSRVYRESLYRRVILDTLPSAVECKLYDHAYGKPIEHVQIEDVSSKFDNASYAELEQRAATLLTLARQLRMSRDSEETGPVH